MRYLVSTVCSVIMLLASFANAEQGRFYEGKRLNVIVNYGAGGSTDILARLFAKHLEKHIPGNPEVIVTNMAGAGGIVATNHMGEVAKADGLTLAFFATPFMQYALKDPALTVDLSKFVWLGGFGQTAMCFIRKDAGTGIESVDNLLEIGEFKLGGYRATSSTDIRMLLGLDILGASYRHVTGYRSSAKVLAALLQNEVSYSCGSASLYRKSFEPNLVEPGLAVPLYYYSLVDAEGVPVKDALFENIPTFVEVHEKLKGEKPSGMPFEALTAVNNIAATLLRGVFLPEGAPDEAAEALRIAWKALPEDDEFIADYRSIVGAPPSLLDGVQAKAQLDSLANLEPDIITFIKGYILE